MAGEGKSSICPNLDNKFPSHNSLHMLLRLLMVENDQDDRQLTEETFRQEWPEASIDFLYGVDLPVWLMRTDSRPHLILIAMHAQPFKATEMITLIRAKTGFETT